MSSRHEINTQGRDGYEKCVKADKLVAQGRLEEARELMLAAAAIDRTYAVRADLIGQADGRRIEVVKTVRRILVPFLGDIGFKVRGGGPWSEREFMERSGAPGSCDSVLIARSKFGHRLGVMATRERASQVEYFDWQTVGIHSGTLAYSTQREVEAVCELWRSLISEQVVPWWESV